MTKKTRQRKNMKRRSRKQSSRRRVMRQRGGRVFEETADTSFYTVNKGVIQKVSKNSFEDEYESYIGSGDSKFNQSINMLIKYEQKNGDHYLTYTDLNPPY